MPKGEEPGARALCTLRASTAAISQNSKSPDIWALAVPTLAGRVGTEEVGHLLIRGVLQRPNIDKVFYDLIVLAGLATRDIRLYDYSYAHRLKRQLEDFLWSEPVPETHGVIPIGEYNCVALIPTQIGPGYQGTSDGPRAETLVTVLDKGNTYCRVTRVLLDDSTDNERQHIIIILLHGIPPIQHPVVYTRPVDALL